MPSTRSAPPTWPIVARERESHRIVEALRRAPFRVQLLIGPPGVGKTVLASSVTTRFPDHRPIRIVGLTELAGIPLGAFAPAFAELGVPADPDRAVPALMAEVGLDAARHLLVVDDLMRLDDVSAATVYQLVRAFGVPTLATARLGEPPPSPIARMIDEGLVDQHEIGGLSLEQVDELLERRFDAPATYADVRRLTDRTAGNPLYLRTLVERADRVGGVRRDGDRIHIDDGGPSHGLHGAMEQNLSELDPASRRLLRVIAFLQPVDPVLLGRSGASRTDLWALEDRGLVSSEPGTGRIRITHPLIAESLTVDRHDGSADDLGDVIAHLRSTGVDADRLHAVRLEALSGPPSTEELVWASGYAYGIGDTGLTAELASLLLDTEPERAHRCFALTTLGSARSLRGESTSAEQAFDEAEALAETADELALVAVRRGEHLSYRRHDPRAALAQAERIRARIDVDSDALDDSLDRWNDSVDVIAGMPLLGRLAYRMKPELTIRSAILLTVSRSTRGDLGSAQEAIGDLVRIQEQVGQVDPSAAAAIGFARFVELICAGRVAEAADYLEERRVDADTGVGVYTMLLGNLRQCGGHLADAERLTTLAVDQLRWRDGLGLLGVALGYQANALAKRGQVDRARRILDGMTPSQREERHAFIQVAEAEAWISIHAGEHDRAVGLVTAAAERGLGSRAVFLSALATCILIRLGRVEAAADLLERLADATTADLEIVCCIRDLAVVLRDRDHQALPAVLRRVEAAGQAPTVLDAAHHAMAARPGPELRRKLDLLSIRLSTSIDEPALHARKPLLSPRELEVARAAAARRRSKEIAVDLGTSARTVDTQLQSVYRKLEITGRDELRTALDEVGLLDENPPKDGATEHHRRA